MTPPILWLLITLSHPAGYATPSLAACQALRNTQPPGTAFCEPGLAPQVVWPDQTKP